MSEQSTNLHLPYVMPAQAQKHVTVNESFRRLDALVQTSVESRTQRREPDSPGDGTVYIIPPGKYGTDWNGLGEQVLAVYRDGSWEVFFPRPGWTVYVRDEALHYVYNGRVWQPLMTPCPMGGRRSLIINGALRFWQRIQKGGAGYVADRFFLFCSDSGITLSQERSQDVPPGEGFENSLKLTLDKLPAPQARLALWQVVEGVGATLSSLSALTLSFWIKGPEGARLGFGLQGEGEKKQLEHHTLRGDWKRLTMTRTPDIKGGDRCRAVLLDGPQKPGQYLITGVQLEGGFQAGPFEHQSLSEDYALCQRYFQKSYPLNTPYGSHTQNGSYVETAQGSSAGVTLAQAVRFHHPMRTPPAIALYGTKGERNVWTSPAAPSVTAEAGMISETGFRVTSTQGAQSGRLYEIHWAADADFYDS